MLKWAESWILKFRLRDIHINKAEIQLCNCSSVVHNKLFANLGRNKLRIQVASSLRPMNQVCVNFSCGHIWNTDDVREFVRKYSYKFATMACYLSV